MKNNEAVLNLTDLLLEFQTYRFILLFAKCISISLTEVLMNLIILAP